MKVYSSGVWRESLASADGACHASDRHRPAFEQVLRVMEKDMWPGAKAGSVTGERLPKQERSDTTKGFPARSTLGGNTDANKHAWSACVASAGQLNAPDSAKATGLCNGLHSPATRPMQPANDSLEQAHLGPVAIALDISPTLTPDRNPDALTAVPPMRQTSSPAAKTRIVHAPFPPVVTPANSACSSPSYRLTVMNGAVGLSVALRVSATHADELDTLIQSARDELAGHAARGGRLIVNGVEHSELNSRGTPHGH